MLLESDPPWCNVGWEVVVDDPPDVSDISPGVSQSAWRAACQQEWKGGSTDPCCRGRDEVGEAIVLDRDNG